MCVCVRAHAHLCACVCLRERENMYVCACVRNANEAKVIFLPAQPGAELEPRTSDLLLTLTISDYPPLFCPDFSAPSTQLVVLGARA